MKDIKDREKITIKAHLFIAEDQEFVMLLTAIDHRVSALTKHLESAERLSGPKKDVDKACRFWSDRIGVLTSIKAQLQEGWEDAPSLEGIQVTPEEMQAMIERPNELDS